MNKFLISALLLAFSLKFFPQQNTHPRLVPVYNTGSYYDRKSHSYSSSSYLSHWMYGKKQILNSRKGRKELLEIFKLEPAAYKLYKQSYIQKKASNFCFLGAGALFIMGYFPAIRKDTIFPRTWFGSVGLVVTASILRIPAYYKSKKAIKIFNEKAVDEVEVEP